MEKLSKKLAEINGRLDGLDLSDEEREQVRTRAREHVEKERKDKAIDILFDAEVKRERRKHIREEQEEDIMVDLPKNAAMIRLDSVMYFHGLTYTVPYSVARTMHDIMARMWEHQSEIEGRPRRGDLAMHQRHNTLGPGQENVNVRSSFTTGVRQ